MRIKALFQALAAATTEEDRRYAEDRIDDRLAQIHGSREAGACLLPPDGLTPPELLAWREARDGAPLTCACCGSVERSFRRLAHHGAYVTARRGEYSRYCVGCEPTELARIRAGYGYPRGYRGGYQRKPRVDKGRPGPGRNIRENGLRLCTGCGQELTAEHFRPRQTRCVSCIRAYAYRRYARLK